MNDENRFTGKVKISGINPYVEVPEEIWEDLSKSNARVLLKVTRDPMPEGEELMREHGPIRDADRLIAIGRLTGEGWFRTTLVPSRSGPARLYLDTWMRDKAGLEVGDTARVRLRRDPESREVEMPVLLVRALEQHSDAWQAWQDLSPSRRQEILTYLNFLKTPAALERNVAKIVDALLS